MSGTCKLAMFVKACRPKWAHLHSADIETLRPTVRHTVNHISPLTKAAVPWETADEHDPIVEFAPEPDAET